MKITGKSFEKLFFLSPSLFHSFRFPCHDLHVEKEGKENSGWQIQGIVADAHENAELNGAPLYQVFQT